jgi:hypothetical protein
MRNSVKFAGSLCLLLAVAVPSALAQSTIFNIPTTDAVSKGKVYFEFDYLVQTPKFDALPGGIDIPRLHAFVPRVVAGIGGNIEAGANVTTYHQGDTDTVWFQPNLKWKFFGENGGFSASAGTILYTPLNHRESYDTFGLVYANVSRKLDHKYGPRLHVGPYGILGTDNAFGVGGPRAGVIAGYEQPLHPRISIVADWLSGKNGFGYFTPGISISLPGNGLFNAGYSIGNDSWANNNATRNRLLFLYYGVTF